MKALLGFLFAGTVLYAADLESRDARVAQHYQVERVPIPVGVDPQIGALAMLADGRLVACFHHGEIAFFDPKSGAWQIFAEGLHEPLGVVPEEDGSLLVMQRPELTRLRDLNRDGVADEFETVWDRFGMTGNYHEYAFGPVRGPNGRLYIGLNLASSADTIREEIRGEWSLIGVPREKFYTEWKKVLGEVGRMYSRVPWRGWVMELDPATSKVVPFACGFRSPDGLAFDARGNLLVDDNQGDWRGTNELHVVQRGGFYGHPASLVWRDDWDGSVPHKLPIEKLNALRTPAAICFPYGTYANSPTQIVVIPKTPAWGPFGGQTLVGEMNSPRLLRVLLEEVDGVWQGACVALVETEALKRGLHRLTFAGDTLYLGRTHLAWAGGEGLAALKPTGRTPFDPLNMQVTPRGFRFEFTEPLASSASDPARWAAQRYFYAYHATYGSPEMEKAAAVITRVTLSNEGRTAEVEFAGMKVDFIYDFDLSKLESATGTRVLNPRIAYTLRRVPAR